MSGTVAFFDFLSHPFMHLPFNEAYLRVLRKVFPDKDILFAACQGHVDGLSSRFDAEDDILFEAVKPLAAPAGKSLHYPWVGRRAARQCFDEVRRVLAGKDVHFAALGGMDANLLGVFRKSWPRTYDAPLHYVLHNHLAASKRWRSRNPIVRAFDFHSVFSGKLPIDQSILTLELGLADMIDQEFSSHRGRVLTLEHPVVESEIVAPRLPSDDRPLRIGFCGHCGVGKGFDVFVELADEFTGPLFEFRAIGLANPNAGHLDLSSLTRKPSPKSVPRDIFLDALRDVDFICLPLPQSAQYVSSGSVIDAFTAAKPLLATSNSMLEAIRSKYGDYGVLFSDKAALRRFFAEADRNDIDAKYASWASAAARISEARRQDNLASNYRNVISPAPASHSGAM